MDCKIMQKSLKTLRFKGKMHTTPLKRLAKVQLLCKVQYLFYFFFENLRFDSVGFK